MTIEASVTNELLCDNNTIKTIFQSVRFFLKKEKLGFLDKIFSKNNFFFISNQVYKNVKVNKAR